MRWSIEMDSRVLYTIVTASRNGSVSYFKDSFHGRAQFHPGNFSLCISAVHKADSRIYTADFIRYLGFALAYSQYFRVSVWDPVPEPSLQSQILYQNRGWCLLSLLCSSPANGSVSISWECPKHSKPTEFPEFPKCTESWGSPEFPESQSQRFQWMPEDAEPQICLCNLSNPADWRAVQTLLTCTGIPWNFSFWAALAVDVGLKLLLILLGVCWDCRRRRKENSRAGDLSC
ncbi:uncharacterized protein LOC117008592 isoform X2 [Catharus ustulatus]|nr:uncharacterized protein LOC117008592 isoform X2 [Catharus ustulatus]